MRLLLAAVLLAGTALGSAREDAFRQRARRVIEYNAAMLPGYYQQIAARLWLKQDPEGCSRQVLQLLKGPQSGDMFWMFPVTAVAYLGRDQLSPEARAALRRAWRTYMPYRGDTENHWLLYYSTLYLMAQLYPHEPGETWFTGRSSEENFREADSYLKAWMELTTTRGQGEYDCTHYIGVYMLPLSFLAAWAEDPEMRLRARMMLDYITADYAVESLDGMYVGAHARTDDKQVLEKWNGASSDFGWLLFGQGRPTPGYGLYALMYALASAYCPPEVIHQIAVDRSRPYLHRELKRTRNRWRFSAVRNAPVYKTTYMRREYAVGSDQGGLLQPVQQHSWDVTWALDDPRGRQNTMFSMHPYSSPYELQMYFTPMPDFITEWVYRSKHSYDSPDKFLGGSPYEQIVQDRDTVIALYNIAPGTRWPHINGFFSKDLSRFEEHPSRWIFAQGGQCYLAYYPLAPYEWRPMAGGSRRLYSPHLKNGTILQAAAASEFADFEAFKKAILALPLEVSLDPVPSVRFRTLRGKQLDFTYGKPPADYGSWKTFEGPYLHCERGSRKLVLTHGALRRTLDFDNLKVTDEGLPVAGIAHVAVRVTDLERARDFYGRVLGFSEAFQFTDNGRTTVAFMKVNDRQYIELYPGRKPGQPAIDHVCFDASDIAAVRQKLVAFEPTAVEKGRAGNLLFAVRDPGGFIVEFLEFLPGSLHLNATGKALGAKRISDRLLSAVVPVKNRLGLEQWIEPGDVPRIRFAGAKRELVDPEGVHIELVEP